MSHPVLAGVDGSAGGTAAAAWAAREAALRGVPLRLVHASPPLPGTPGTGVPAQAAETLRHVGERLLQREADALSGRHPDIEVLREQSDQAPAVTLLAAARGAGLLVVGARGTGGFDGLAVGSVALRVAAAAACPVAVVPRPPAGASGERTHAARVVVGSDAQHPASEPLEFAFSAAEARGAELLVVRAWALPADSVSLRTPVVTEEDRATWEDQEVQRLSDALRAWREKYPAVGLRPDVVLLHPAQALLNASGGAGLLVVGRRTDPRAAEGRLGPVTHAVLHDARCPVVVVPHAA